MIKFGLLVGVLVVGIVLIIVGAGGPSAPAKVGGVVPKSAQEKHDSEKSTFTWSLIIGIVVCLLSLGGFALMLRSSGKGQAGQTPAATAQETPPQPPAEEAQEAQEDQEADQSKS